MEFTTNPTIGGNGGDWGSILNQILNELKSAANTLESGKANSVHPHINLATTQALAALALTVEGKAEAEALAALALTVEGKADAQALTALTERVEILEPFINLLSPDLTALTVSLALANTSAGIRIVFNTTPVTPATNYSVQILKAGEVVTAIGGGNSILVIPPEFFFAPVTDGDLLSIIGTIRVGQSTKVSQAYSFTYNVIESAIAQQMTALQTQLDGLTIPAFVAGFKGDENAMQDLANVVHGSNILAQKVYELGVN